MVAKQEVQIGSVTLQGFECPEQIHDLFGVHKYAVHDFTGGDRTIQGLGAFPSDTVNWSGHFFTDQTSDAFGRATILNKLRVQGDPVSFQYGGFNTQVVIEEFKVHPRLKQWLPYTIKLIPESDSTSSSNQQSSGSSAAGGVGQFQFNGSVPSANAGVTSAVTSPASGAALPSSVTAPTIAMQLTLNAALVQANQSLPSIPQATINGLVGSITAIQNSLAPLIAGTNNPTASAASDLNGQLGALSNALQVPANSAIRNVVVNNPNLIQLASEFYAGDTSQWQTIAEANGFTDWLITGRYALVIPNAK